MRGLATATGMVASAASGMLVGKRTLETPEKVQSGNSDTDENQPVHVFSPGKNVEQQGMEELVMILRIVVN